MESFKYKNQSLVCVAYQLVLGSQFENIQLIFRCWNYATLHFLQLLCPQLCSPMSQRRQHKGDILIYQLTCNWNLSLPSPPYLEVEEIKNYKQKLSYFWLAQSGVGIAGTVLNSFVLWIFWKERQSLNTSINTMTRYADCSKKWFRAVNIKWRKTPLK